MIISVASFKGGVAKTTSSVHLAAYLQTKAPTLLVDGDPNRSALAWAARGQLPFRVVDGNQGLKLSRQFEHLVIDTRARPDVAELQGIAEGCDLLVIPSTPDALALDVLSLTIEALRDVEPERYRVLLTIIPPKPARHGEMAREAVRSAGLPVFRGSIRRYAAFWKAALAGVLVKDVSDPHAGDGWADYQRIGREILK